MYIKGRKKKRFVDFEFYILRFILKLIFFFQKKDEKCIHTSNAEKR